MVDVNSRNFPFNQVQVKIIHNSKLFSTLLLCLRETIQTNYKNVDGSMHPDKTQAQIEAGKLVENNATQSKLLSSSAVVK